MNADNFKKKKKKHKKLNHFQMIDDGLCDFEIYVPPLFLSAQTIATKALLNMTG